MRKIFVLVILGFVLACERRFDSCLQSVKCSHFCEKKGCEQSWKEGFKKGREEAGVKDSYHGKREAHGTFEDGWKDGFESGWRSVKGSMGIVPITPICPIPRIGKDSYEDGFDRGFARGRDRAQ